MVDSTSEPATGMRSVFDVGTAAIVVASADAWQIIRSLASRLSAALAALRAHRSRRGLVGVRQWWSIWKF